MALKYLYVPSGYKAGTAYGVLPNNSTADFDNFVRATPATRTNKDGLLESMATNVPRLDYTDGSCPTLLTEPASTNLLHNSGWEGGGSLPTNWNYSFSTGTSTSVTSTKGTTINAYRFQTASTRQVISRTFTSAVSTTYTLSVYVESVTGSIRARDILYKFNGGGTFIWRKDGVVVTENETIVSGSFYSITFTATLVETVIFRLGLGVLNVSTGDVTLSQPQVEELPYRTSFMISAIGAIATRSADTGVISGDLSSYINSSEGVLFIEASALGDYEINRRMSINDGTTSNRISIGFSVTPNTLQFIAQSNNQVEVNSLVSISDATSILKIAFKYKTDSCSFFVNGVKVGSDNNASMPIGMNKISLDEGNGSFNFYSKLKQIKYYNEELTDSELIQLTS